VQTVDFNMLHATLPYAIAFLEENQESGLIEHVLNSNYGFFSMIYTDMKDNVKFSTKSKLPHVKLNKSDLNQYQFSFVFKTPFPQQCSAKTPYEDQAFLCTEKLDTEKLDKEVDAYGKIYLLRREIPSFIETISSRLNLESFGFRNESIDDYVLNIIINLGFIFIIILSGIIIIKIIKKNERLLKQNHEREIEILKLKMDGLNEEIEKKEKSIKDKSELIELYESDGKDSIKLKEERDTLRQDLSQLKNNYSQLNDKYNHLSAKYQEKESELSSVIRKDEFQNIIEYLWPNLIFEPKAIKEMKRLYRSDRHSSKDICHALSEIEALRGDVRNLKRPYIVKRWVDSKEPIIEIKFNPRRRIYINSEKEKTRIKLIDPCKSEETERIAQKTFQ
jgi:hypothetical protein